METKNKNSIINLFRYLWKYSINTKKNIVLFVFLAVMAEGMYLIIPLIIGNIFNSIQFNASDPNFFYSLIFKLFLIFVISILSWVFHGPSRVLEKANGFLVRKNYRGDMINKVMQMPAEWHINHHSGDTIDKINTASSNLFAFSSDINFIISSIVRLLGSVIILLFFDWRSSLIAAIAAGITIVMIIGFDKRIKKLHDKFYKLENYLASAIHDYISNIMTIISLKLTKRAENEIEKRDMMSYPVFKKNNKLIELKWFLASFFIYLMTFTALSANAYRSYRLSGIVAIGALFTLYSYLENVGHVFYNFAWQYGEIIKQDATIRVAETIEDDYKKLAQTKNIKLDRATLPNNWKTLQIKNLSFKYSAEDQQIKKSRHIENVSFTIGKYQKIAFIGESGSGKSTMLALLRGLFNAEHSSVYCDGKKLKYNLAHVNNKITIIPQDPEIFNSSIKDNIVMGTGENKNKLKEVMKIARFEKVAARLKKGIETNVMEKGVSLSGGEKQRLALARGLYSLKDNEFLFLDEPTSSVDSDNELKIYKNVFEKFKDRTIISSIHRLHLLELFDYIYYFKNGKILTEGTLMSLLEDKDFKILWQNYKREGDRKK